MSAASSSVEQQENPSLQELQETVSRLSALKGVVAVLILNRSGDILVESSSNGAVDQAKYVKKLMQAANDYLRSLQPDDEVNFMHIRSKEGQEIMVAPHEGYVLAVLKR